MTTPRVFYDTEFIEDGSTVDLVSIGMVAQDERAYYAQSVEFSPARANAWVRENVLVHLAVCPTVDPALAHATEPYDRMLASLRGHLHLFGAAQDGKCALSACPWRSRAQLRDDVSAFLARDVVAPDVARDARGKRMELWGYYSAYDHVALAQVFGTMMDLPAFVPMYTNDLKQYAMDLGDPTLPDQDPTRDGPEHHALSDARWNKRAWTWLRDFEEHKRLAEWEQLAQVTVRNVGQLLLSTPPRVAFTRTDASSDETRVESGVTE